MLALLAGTLTWTDDPVTSLTSLTGSTTTFSPLARGRWPR